MQWARQPQTDEHGGSTLPPPLGSTTSPLDSSLEDMLLWCGKGSGGYSRGPFAHPRCAHGPLLDLAQALLIDEPLALGGHAVHIQVV